MAERSEAGVRERGRGFASGLIPADVAARPDLLLLAALVVLTMTFGRSFAILGVPGTPVKVTEIALLAIVVLAVRRTGVSAAAALIRSRLPVVALLVLLVVAAIATVRGLAEFGAAQTEEDVGLGLYVLVVPIVALVVSDRPALRFFGRALLVGSAAAVALWLFAYVLQYGAGVQDPLRPNGTAAAGLYMAVLFVWALARYAHALPLTRWDVAGAALALVATGLTDKRGTWLAAFAALAALIAVAGRPRIVRAVLAVAAALVATAVLTLAVEVVVDPISSEQAQIQRQGGPALEREEGPQALQELGGLSGSGENPEAANVGWRLDFWRYGMERMRDEPLGIGFGQPTRFVWRGERYDFRRGDPGDHIDVTGPHNSFVETGYRMGVIGLLALLAVVAIAAVRVIRLIARPGLGSEDRPAAAALLALLVNAVVVASFNDALKNPYIGLLFWSIVALALIAPFLLRSAGPGEEAR